MKKVMRENKFKNWLTGTHGIVPPFILLGIAIFTAFISEILGMVFLFLAMVMLFIMMAID